MPELQFPWHGAKKNHLKRTVQQNSQCINTLQRAVGWEAWPWQTSFICPVICVQIHRHSLKPYPNYSHYYQKLLSEVPNRHRTAPFPSVVPARAQMQLQAKQAILNPILPVNFNLSTSVTMAGWSWLVHKWAQHWSAGKALLAAPQEPQPFLGSFGFFGFCLPSGYRFFGVAAVTACRCWGGTGEDLEVSGVRQTADLTGTTTIIYQWSRRRIPSNSNLSVRTAHQAKGELPTVCIGWHGGAKTFHASCVRLWM